MLIVYLQYSTHLHEDMHAQLSLAKKILSSSTDSEQQCTINQTLSNNF